MDMQILEWLYPHNDFTHTCSYSFMCSYVYGCISVCAHMHVGACGGQEAGGPLELELVLSSKL